MNASAQSAVIDTVAAERHPAGKQQRRRRTTVFYAFLGTLASAAAGAALGYGRDGVECVLLDSPATIRAGSRATVQFLLNNGTGRTVKLRPRSNDCRARLEGVPRELMPNESREIGLVLNTAGLNGQHRFSAAISTDATPRLVALTADLKIHADWVVRRFMLGGLPASVPVVKRIRIDNVPAQNLVRVGSPTEVYWSASLASVSDRSVEIDLAATLPHMDSGMSGGRTVCDFSLFFTDADVRRVQVMATALVTADADHSGSRLTDAANRELNGTFSDGQELGVGRFR